MKPRVLILHNFLTPYRIPLFAELAKRFELEVWLLGDVRAIREWPGEVPPDAFRHRFLPHWGMPTGSRDYRLLINYSLPWALPDCRPDVLVCCGWDTPAVLYAARWAKRKRVPLVLWSGSTAGEPNWRRTVSRPLVQRYVRKADAWVAYGTRAQEYLVSLGADASRVFRAYNTVDTTHFAQAAAASAGEEDDLRRRLGVGNARVVLYCGQLIDRKGLPDLIPAFGRFAREHEGVTLVVAGSGKREDAYRGLANSAGVEERVVFAGFVAREQLPAHYAMADLFTLPSRQEVWGLVINEALACGVPVLTTNATGASVDLIRDGVNGYAVPAASPEALYQALKRHFADETDLAAMRTAARESIAPFTIARAADAFDQAVACALGRG